jgi:outer membrane protein OmpA-like peptidoglycan-associated protein
VKHSPRVMFLIVALAVAAEAQTAPKLAPDQAGCVDSKFLPKLLECRIDNCEKKDSDHRDISVGEDEKGEPVNTAVDGNSRSVMYECREGTTAASIVEKAAAGLKAAGFEIPYKFTDAESALTARKSELWVTVEAVSQYYTLTEISSVAPDFDAVVDASSMADALERYGHVPLYAVQFVPGRSELAPSSSSSWAVLDEVVTMMNDHPAWRVRVEGHTDDTGTKMGNMTLSFKRASAVVTWLAGNGVKRSRLDPQGIGDAHPVADNSSEAGRNKNRRIELVKIPSPLEK